MNRALASEANAPLRYPFDDLDLLHRQSVQLIHQLIDLPARGVDLALEGGLLVVDLG